MDSNPVPPSYQNPNSRAVAIVGMAIQAPGGTRGTMDTPDLFEFLKMRGSGIVTVPSDRWNAQAYLGEAPGKIVTDKGAYLSDVGIGDLQEFGISTREASQISPHQLHSLHVAFDALQRSGIDFRGTNTGVFIGCASSDLGLDQDEAGIQEYYCTGSATSIVANRISYVFDLTGPSLPVDTACSSALTAMHLAVQAIRNGDCDQAVVGGVSFVLSLLDAVSFSRLGVLSPDGISKSFDADANGYARGEVAGAVVIKRHDLAVRDGDHIHGTLVGTALTTCGSAMGSLTTPNPVAQTEAICRAYADAGLQPCEADFVELHGTGTKVGDRIEANAAGEIFARGRNGLPLPIGSIKSNLGHGEMGAYISSLIKVLMMLERRIMLPNGYFKKPSPEIEFTKYNLRVPVVAEDFVPQNERTGLVASISSYGFGGSCGHTVLREHEARPERPTELADIDLHLFAIGALSPRACNSLVGTYTTAYSDAPARPLSEHTGTRARQMPWRTFVVASKIAHLSQAFPEPTLVTNSAPSVVFCFSGQGPQHIAMGRGLFYHYSVFRDSILASDQVYCQQVGESFLEVTGLFISDQRNTSSPISDQHTIWPAFVISVALTMFQVALHDLLLSLGVCPTVVIGHSIGETAAFYASGAMSREMVIRIAIARGRALSLVDGEGSMLAVSGCTEEELVSCFPTDGHKALHIASINTIKDFGVSGTSGDIDHLKATLEEHFSGVKAVKLRVSTAVHSPFVDPIQVSYRHDLDAIFSSFPGPHVPTIPIVSSVTAQVVLEPYDANYMWNNLRQPVRFHDAMSTVRNTIGNNFVAIELSSHPVLAQYLYSFGAAEVITPSRRLSRSDVSNPLYAQVRTFLEALGTMLLSGINSINFRRLNGWPRGHIDAPPYPFQKKSHNIFPQVPSYHKRLQPHPSPLNSENLRVSPSLPEPWMADHVINHSNIIPASAYIEMALEFPGVTSVWDFEFAKAFALDDDGKIGTLHVKKIGGQVEIASSTTDRSLHPVDEGISSNHHTYGVVHARGRIGYGKPRLDERCLVKVDVSEVASRCPFYFTAADVYKELSTWCQFGPSFRRVLRGCANDQEVVCWIRGPVDISSTEYVFHPALMDAAFQSFVGWPLQWAHVNTSTNNSTFGLPHSVERAFRNDGSVGPLVLPAEFSVYSRITEWTPHSRRMDCFILDVDGRVLFTFLGLQFLEPRRPTPPPSRYTEYWQERSFPSQKLEFSLPRALSPSVLDEIVCVSQALDGLAHKYTRRTMEGLPPLPEVLPYDRQRYLQWATQLRQEEDFSLVLPDSLQDEKNPLRELTERVARAQADIILSSTAAVQALFVDDLMSKIYELTLFDGEVFHQLTEAVVKAIVHAFSCGRKVVRILEIGAGTGRVTALIGEALLSQNFPSDVFVEYVCTDVSISLAQEASKKSPWHTTTAKAFDITRPAVEQNIMEASFDVIVAFDVLHAIADLRNLLPALKRLLVPGGFLATIELDGEAFESSLPGTKWLDYIFGSFREWFGALESRDNGATHCTLTQEMWNQHLRRAGFTVVSWTRDMRPTARHIAFLAQNPDFTEDHDQILLTPDCDSPSPTLLYHWAPQDEIGLVAFLSKQDSSQSTAIWVHTEDTVPGRALLGLVRSLQQEFPLWYIRTVLFNPHWCLEAQTQFIRQHLVSLSSADSEILVNADGSMHVSRLIPWPDPPPSRELRECEVLAIDSSSEALYPTYISPLGLQEVEVMVDHVTPISWFNPFAEFTGTVVRIGGTIDTTSATSKVRLGQRVFGMAEKSRSRLVTCPVEFVQPLPSHLVRRDSVAAAIGFATLARIIEDLVRPNKLTTRKALVHFGDAPELAVATYEILESMDLELAITADDPHTISGQYEVAAFATDAVEHWTNFVRTWAPKGVDMIFNFHPSACAFDCVASLLNPTGTMVQFVSDNFTLHGSAPLLKYAQRYINMDLYSLVNARPAHLQTAFAEIGGCLAARLNIIPEESHELLPPLRTTSDWYSVVKNRLIRFDELTVTQRQVSNSRLSFDPRRTYVIVGGIGGVGITFALCLVERGAQNIILTSRSGEKGLFAPHLVRERLILAYLRGLAGVTIQLVAVDCTKEAEMRNLFSTINCAGIFFMPVHLQDDLALNMTQREDWDKVYEVKVKGLETLLRVVDARQLDFLLVASSMASVLGSPGQANYTASQTWMEAVAGVVPNCVTVAVPPILDGGVFVKGMTVKQTRNAALEKYLRFGMLGTDFCFYCLDAISMVLSGTAPQLYIPEVTWEHTLQLVPSYAQGRISHLIRASSSLEQNDTRDILSLSNVCASVLALDPHCIEDNMPLSFYGLDSLTSVRLSNILKGKFGLVVTQMQLLAATMTVTRLQQLYVESHQEADHVPRDEAYAPDGQQASSIQDLSDNLSYSADYELLRQKLKASYPPVSPSYTERPLTILLTGATGFVGSFLLKELLAHVRVKKVICLIRSNSTTDPVDRLRTVLSSQTMWNDDWLRTSRLQALRADLSLEHFGVDGDVWDHLAMDVDCIIHNGAQVHWIHSYETLRATNVLSVLDAIALASMGRPKFLLYVSSVATLGSSMASQFLPDHTSAGHRVGEDFNLEATRETLTFGYAQSKWVSENLLHDAAQRGLTGYIVKPSFILGDSILGACNSDDFFWRFVKGCVQLGHIPNLTTSLNAIPVDQLAALITHGALYPCSIHLTRLRTLHLDHDTRFSLPQLAAVLRSRGYRLRSCDLSSWLAQLEHAITAEEDNALLPVLDFAHSLEYTFSIPPLDTTNTGQLLSSRVGLSVTMRITDEIFTKYLSWLTAKDELPAPIQPACVYLGQGRV